MPRRLYLKGRVISSRRELEELEQQLAATGEGIDPEMDTKKVLRLVTISQEVMQLIHQRTYSQEEARFVAAYVKGAMDYWWGKR